MSKEALEHAFTFSCERMKKYFGRWHVNTYTIFPNYIFLESNNPNKLHQELKHYREVVDILEKDRCLLSVNQEEELALKTLCDPAHHIKMSKGIISENGLRVLEGPLTGKEAMIQKVDLHKRIAVLSIRPLEKGRDIWVGLEIIPTPID